MEAENKIKALEQQLAGLKIRAFDAEEALNIAKTEFQGFMELTAAAIGYEGDVQGLVDLLNEKAQANSGEEQEL